jgi:hypothetical protein
MSTRLFFAFVAHRLPRAMRILLQSYLRQGLRPQAVLFSPAQTIYAALWLRLLDAAECFLQNRAVSVASLL